MPWPRSPFVHIARLYVQPFPTTHSANRTIFAQLKQYGAVAVLHPHPSAISSSVISSESDIPDQAPPQLPEGDGYYTVAYTSLTRLGRDAIRGDTKTFTLTSDAPDRTPLEEDPYNVRGLLERKPLPPPQTFTCTLAVHPEAFPDQTYDHRHARERSIAQLFKSPRYDGRFRVDRSDDIKEVLEDCKVPLSLVIGLLEQKKGVLRGTARTRKNAKGDLVQSLEQYGLAKMYRAAHAEEKPSQTSALSDG